MQTMRKGSHFYRRLLIAFLLIMIVYTMALAGLFFFNKNKMTEIEQDNKRLQFMEQTRDQIDIRLSIGNNLINQLKVNEYVVKYAESEEEDYYLITKALFELRTYIDAFIGFGYRVDLIKSGSSVVITPDATQKPTDYFNDIGLHSDFFEKSDDLERDLVFLTTFTKKRSDYITFARKVEYRNHHELFFILSLYADNVLPAFSNENSEGFGIVDRNGLITFKQGSTTVDQTILSEELIASFFEEAAPYSTVLTNDYDVHSIVSRQKTDWRYVYLVSRNLVQSKLADTMLKSLFLYALLNLLGILFVLLVTNCTYRPIRKMVQLFRSDYNGEEFGTYNNRDELSYICETAVKITKDNQKLIEKIKESEVSLKEAKWRELLSGLIPEYELAHQPGIVSMKGTWRVVLIEYRYYTQLEQLNSQESLYELKKEVQRIIADSMQKSANSKVFDINYKQIAVLLNEESLASIKTMLQHAFNRIHNGCGISMIAVVSKLAPSIQNARSAYHNAKQLIEERQALDSRTIIIQDEQSIDKSNQFYYPLDVERELMNQIMLGKLEDAMSLLDQILEENFVRRTLGREAATQLLFAIVSTVHRILQATNTSSDELFGEGFSLYNELKTCESEQLFKQKISDCFIGIEEYIRVKKREQDNNVAEQMIAYIQEHYHTDFSLIDLSNAFNLSSGYVSQLFKSSTGENFKDYLNIYRVKQAKILLEETDLKIQEIAQRVGCNHSNTFIRMFKKYEGVSPGQFAKDLARKSRESE